MRLARVSAQAQCCEGSLPWGWVAAQGALVDPVFAPGVVSSTCVYCCKKRKVLVDERAHTALQ